MILKLVMYFESNIIKLFIILFSVMKCINVTWKISISRSILQHVKLLCFLIDNPKIQSKDIPTNILKDAYP